MNKTMINWILGILIAVLAFATILIPDKNTLIQMLLAKYATYDNAATVIQTVQNAADYIIESVGKLK